MTEISLSGITSGQWFRACDFSISSEYGKILVSMELLEKYVAFIEDSTVYLALSITPDVDVRGLGKWLTRLKMIELSVENFTDGRVFTQARTLRDLGFKGEIKVCGPLVPDQALFFARVGVDTLSIGDDGRVEDFKTTLNSYNIFYQSSSDAAIPVPQLREDHLAKRKKVS